MTSPLHFNTQRQRLTKSHHRHVQTANLSTIATWFDRNEAKNQLQTLQSNSSDGEEMQRRLAKQTVALLATNLTWRQPRSSEEVRMIA